MMTKLAPCALTALLACTFLYAQDQSSPLDPVTISTSLTPEKTSRTGRNIFVVRGDQLTTLPVHSIDELLRFLPGIEMQARGPLGAQSDISIRGTTFQQVLVILDGLRLNDPATGHFTAYIPISPAEIERIEILKGASSAVYGAEAVGGVIHIITKTFAAKKGLWKSDINAQVAAGQYDLLSVNAGGFFSNGKTAIGAGLLSNNSSGQKQKGINGHVYAHIASFSMSHQINNHWSFKMRYAYEDRKFAAQNFYTSFNSDTATEHIVSFWTQLGIGYAKNKHKLTFNAGYKDLQDFYQYNLVSTPNQNNSKMIQGLLSHEFSLSSKTALVSGTQFISKRIISNDRGIHRIDQAAAFAILNQQLFSKLFLSPALRVEWNQRSGWEVIPQLNISFATGDLKLRASGGKTIRDGDFTERFNNYQKPWVTSGRIGNPDLDTERSLSYEVGLDYFGVKDLKISAGIFSRHQQDLIDYVVTPYQNIPRRTNLSPSGTYALAKNISRIRTSGLEAEFLFVKKTMDNHHWWASAGFTWIQSNSSSETSFYISSHAKLLANFNLMYRAKRWGAVVSGLYKKRNPQEGAAGIAIVSPHYFIMNLKIEGYLVKDKLSLFAEADNIFDRQYADLLGASMPGRWLMGGIKISLSKISEHARSIGSIGNNSTKWWYLNRN